MTLDYLLKDERETEETTGTVAETSVRRVTLAEANEFLAWRERASIRIAAGVFLCILAVVPLLLLAAWAEYSPTGISEELAGVGGLMILLMMVAAAVAIFIFCGFENRSYEFLDKEFFETEYGVRGMVQQRQKEYKTTYARCNVIGRLHLHPFAHSFISGGTVERSILYDGFAGGYLSAGGYWSDVFPGARCSLGQHGKTSPARGFSAGGKGKESDNGKHLGVLLDHRYCDLSGLELCHWPVGKHLDHLAGGRGVVCRLACAAGSASFPKKKIKKHPGFDLFETWAFLLFCFFGSILVFRT